MRLAGPRVRSTPTTPARGLRDSYVLARAATIKNLFKVATRTGADASATLRRGDDLEDGARAVVADAQRQTVQLDDRRRHRQAEPVTRGLARRRRSEEPPPDLAAIFRRDAGTRVGDADESC